MLRKEISSLVLVATITGSSLAPVNVYADTLNVTNDAQDTRVGVGDAKVSRFDTYYSPYRKAYDEVFKMDSSNIESIYANGNYLNSYSTIENMTDGSLDTYWESAKQNSDTFTNEIIFTLKEATVLSRMAYRSAWNTVGFAEEFEIWASDTDEGDTFQLVTTDSALNIDMGDTFQLVATGSATKTADVVEIKFEPTEFKRIKFVFKSSYTNKATASEVMFYKEDAVLDQVNQLFTDETMSEVSEAFSTLEAINALEDEFKSHPLYEEYKEKIDNARTLVKRGEVEAVEAQVSEFGVSDENLAAYNEQFKISRDEIIRASNTGGTSNKTKIENVLDEDLNTFWESGRVNTSTYNNEVEFEFDEIKTINRIVYSAKRGTNRGFAEEFEIYASPTTVGDTFELISTGKAAPTQEAIEIKFEPTEIKRIKFVYKQSVESWAAASEFAFYKEDPLKDKVQGLFTDSTMSEVSEAFNTVEKINELEEEFKSHILYEDYKEYFENARILVNREKIEVTEAKVSKFEPYYSEHKASYDEGFKMDNSNIESVYTNGGYLNYYSTIENMTDGSLDTYWESAKQNSDTYKNEIVFTLKEATVLNRMAYRSAWNTVGFAEEFEIWASDTTKGDTFQLVTTGSATKTADVVEFKFEPTTFKRIKFVFKSSYADKATASEVMFYKEDTVLDKMNSIFTDDTLSTVSEEFNTIEKLNALEEEAKSHPLYEEYKENIENAKKLLEEGKIEATQAKVSKFDTYYSQYKEAYDEAFKMDNSNVESIYTNGGHLNNSVKENMLDGNLETYWESGKQNSDTYKNEIIFTLKEATVLNRMAYRSAWNTVGFAQEFEIWASNTTKGDTFQLVTTGSATKIADVVEIKFEPTKFKRIKFVFKSSYSDKATASEVMFYKEDAVFDKINSIFTDNTYSEVVEAFNTIEKINELEEEVKTHPLKNELQGKIDLAKSIVSGEVDFSKNIFTLKQDGDIVSHIRNNLKMSSFGTNLQSTGIVAIPGEVFNIYVEAEDGKPLPKIAFTQQEGHYGNWIRTYNLKEGINTIVVPEIYSESWSKKSNKGGAVYLLNPYTEEEQGKAPVVRIEGGEHFPLFNEGDDVEEFLEELKAYKEKLDANPDTMVDIFEFNAYRLMFTGRTTEAYTVYIDEGVDVNESINVWDNQFELAMKLAGLSDNSEDVKNDSTNIRTTVRLMQPFGSAYAASDHIGLQRGVMAYFLRTDKWYVNDIIWGTMHELGHQMDIPAREWAEVTNNMWANYATILNGKADRIKYEDLYTTLAPEDSKRDNESVILEMFWQLQLADENYWPNLEKMYREKNPTVADYQEKKDTFAKYSSEILGMNLTPYFEKYNFTLSDECKAELAQLPEMDKKLWYLNTSAMNYTGNGFNDNVQVEISSVKNDSENGTTLTFDIDNTNKEDLLGYEIVRDGKVIGFTSNNTFTDTSANSNENYKYAVIAYARDLSKAHAVEIQSKTPTLLANEKITLKLNEAFNPLNYVNAFDSLGNEIGEIKTTHNVDTTKKGTYNVSYEVVSNGITVKEEAIVEVVSTYDYLSDSEWTSARTGYGTVRKNNDLKLLVNGAVKSFDKGFGIHANGEVVYDLSGKNYDQFEAFIGVSRSIPEQNNSSIVFSIVADGNEIYNSGLMKYADPAKYISLDIRNVKELKIVINDGGNGISSDHAVIGNPILIDNNTKPTLTVGRDESIELKSEYNLMDSVSAVDIEDGDLTDLIVVNDNGFTTDKAGEYSIEYSVTDTDGNTTKAEKKVIVYSETNYLSDMNWASATTEYGSVRKDKASSNVNMKLLVDGDVKEFAKGIGTHASSEIVYNLQGKNYAYFETYVGVDRNIAEQNNSSVIFKIYADGVEVYNSGLMKYNTEAQFVRIPVDGIKELKLVAHNADNGNSYDHANFADAKFLITNSRPELNTPKSMSTTLGKVIDIDEPYTAYDIEDGDLTDNVRVEGTVNFDKTGEYPIIYTVVDSDGNEVVKTRTIAVVDMNDFTYLTDYDWKSESHTYAAPKVDVAISAKPLRLTGENGEEVVYTRGIGAHSISTIIYDLSDKNYDYFTSYVGVDRASYGTIGSVSFEVYVDGEKAFDSGLMNSRDSQKYVQVDINGAKELKLVVTDGGNGNGNDHATWGNTKLHYANENRAPINRVELDALIQTASELNSTIYTEESFRSLEIALENVYDNLSDGYNQEEIDHLYNSLKEAYDALVKVTDFSILEEVIAHNSNLNELHYYKDAIVAHKALVEEAKSILANENATQEEIDDIVNRINVSSQNLVIRENKVALESKIKEAQLEENNNYISIRWENFLWAIEYASDIYNNMDATDEEIRSGIFTIDYFKGELK